MKNPVLINIDKLPTLLKKDYLFIDLRSIEEYQKVHLTKFINIPYPSFNEKISSLPKDKVIILICYSGKRSLDLAKQLNQKGYRACSINGGMYSVLHPISENIY